MGISSAKSENENLIFSLAAATILIVCIGMNTIFIPFLVLTELIDGKYLRTQF